MNFVIDEAAWEAYFNSEQSRFVQHAMRPRVDRVVESARERVGDILWRVPSETLGGIQGAIHAVYEPGVNGYIIGIDDQERLTTYLANKEVTENTTVGTWLRPALRKEFRA